MQILIMFKYSKDTVSVLTVLDGRRIKADGKYPVKVQVIYQRIQKYYSTGKTLTPEEWEKLPTTKAHHLGAIRESIENSFNIVRDQVEDLVFNGNFSFDTLNQRLKRGASGTVNTAFTARMKQMKDDGHIGNMKMYDTILKGLERFSGNNVRFDAITPDWLRKYDKFLLSEGKSRATISMHMRTLRAIINEAKRCGIVRENNYPFGKGRFEIQEGDGRKLALTLDQIGRIATFENGSQATVKYRDYWLFLYFCNGMNVADFIQLKYSNIIDGEICFIRQKTKHTAKKQKEIRAIIIPQVQAIIEKWGNPPTPENYIFPILLPEDTDPEKIFLKKNHFTRALNKRMKMIGKALGIDNITTYTARHSYATVLKRSGANIAYISESLGHNSLQTTETYLASFEKEERQKNALLLTNFGKI